MAGPHWFVGSVSGDFGDGGNWDTGVIPLTAEAWGLNHLTTRAITAGLNQSAKTFSRIVFHPSCAFGVPTALRCNATELRWCGGGEAVYLDGDFENIVCDSPSRTAPGLSVDGAFTMVNILQGLVRLIGAHVAPAASRITVDAPPSAQSDSAILVIDDADLDLVTNETIVKLVHGQIRSVADIERLIQSGGLFDLGTRGAADQHAALAVADCDGGVLQWNSDGTIGELHAGGDHRFSLNQSDLVRTLGTLTMHGDCLIDLSGGFNLTVTNPIRRSGGTLIPPVGRTIALAG